MFWKKKAHLIWQHRVSDSEKNSPIYRWEGRGVLEEEREWIINNCLCDAPSWQGTLRWRREASSGRYYYYYYTTSFWYVGGGYRIIRKLWKTIKGPEIPINEPLRSIKYLVFTRTRPCCHWTSLCDSGDKRCQAFAIKHRERESEDDKEKVYDDATHPPTDQ